MEKIAENITSVTVLENIAGRCKEPRLLSWRTNCISEVKSLSELENVW